MQNSHAKTPRTNTPPAAATEVPMIVADKETAWARLPRESARAYGYFWKYLTMGPNRSIEKVSQEVGLTSRHLKRFSKRWKWMKRKGAYDDCIEAKNMAAAELFAEEEAKKWGQRQRDLRERRYQQALAMIEQVDLMLKYPLTQVKRVVERDETGRETVIQYIIPAKWAKRDAGTLALIADQRAEKSIRNEGGTDEIELQNDWDDMVPYKSARETTPEQV